MTAPSIEGRLRRLEVVWRRDGGGPWFLSWGRTAEDFERAPSAAQEGDRSPRRGQFVRAPWPYPEQPPAARWVKTTDLSEREVEALLSITADGRPHTPDPRLDRMSDEELLGVVLDEMALEVARGRPSH